MTLYIPFLLSCFLFHFFRTSKMFKSGPFWWWWKNTNNWGCNGTMQYWQWKALTNFNLWWDTHTFGVTLSGIWKNRSEIFHGTFCIQWRPRCTLQELGGHENSWFVSKFLLDSREKSCHIFEMRILNKNFLKELFLKKGCETLSKYVPLQCEFGHCCASRQ